VSATGTHQTSVQNDLPTHEAQPTLQRSRVVRLLESPPALLALFIVALCIIFSVLTGSFDTGANAVTIVAGSGVLAMVSLGQTFAMISGGFDLSVAGVAPLGAVVFVILSNDGLPATVAIVAVVAIGAAVGLINGAIITWVGINPLITTLGMLSITGGAAYAASSGITVSLNDPGAGFLANPLPANVPVFVVITIVLAIVGWLLLRFTTIGRSIYAVGGNRSAAWLAGIRVNGLTVVVYALCGALAALAGIVVASELLAGSGTVESTVALESIAAVVLGGAALTGGEGTVAGAMLGVLVIGIIGNGLQLIHISSFYQQIATGAILLLAVGSQRLRRLGQHRIRSRAAAHPTAQPGGSAPQEHPQADMRADLTRHDMAGPPPATERDRRPPLGNSEG